MRIPRGLFALGGIFVALAVLMLGTVQIGLHVPEEEVLAGLPPEAELDYSALLAADLPPLSAEFVATVLGIPVIEQEGTAEGSPQAGSVSEEAQANGRTVVEHELTNDDFDEAVAISSVPFTARTNTAGATREKSEPGDCTPGGGTVWYRYRATKSAGLVSNTVGTTRAITLGVFEGTSLSDLRTVACDTDPGGAAYVPFAAKRSATYYFQITDTLGGGLLGFNLDPLGTTKQVSISSIGRDGSNDSSDPVLSRDGRFVAFRSSAPDLVPDDENGASDVFLRDQLTGKTTLVSLSSSGQQGDGPSATPGLSSDGRYVSFSSCASKLVPDDTNGAIDIFVHDRVTGRTTRVSVGSDGEEARDVPLRYRAATFLSSEQARSSTGAERCDFGGPTSITPDGRYVAFESPFEDLVDGDGNQSLDIFVHDRATAETTLISVAPDGQTGNADSMFPSLSADGRYVAFASLASNLVLDTNNAWDIFVHDRVTGETTRVSVSSSGDQALGNSWTAFISADGRFVGFPSDASNLVDNDTNEFRDAFVHDRVTGRTTRVSVSSTGEEQDAPSVESVLPTGHIGPFVDDAQVAISTDGRYATFESAGTGLVPDDMNGANDIFVHDRETGTTVRVSVSSVGREGDSTSRGPAISADGLVVAFESLATNLARGDADPTIRGRDIFVHVFSRFR